MSGLFLKCHRGDETELVKPVLETLRSVRSTAQIYSVSIEVFRHLSEPSLRLSGLSTCRWLWLMKQTANEKWLACASDLQHHIDNTSILEHCVHSATVPVVKTNGGYIATAKLWMGEPRMVIASTQSERIGKREAAGAQVTCVSDSSLGTKSLNSQNLCSRLFDSSR